MFEKIPLWEVVDEGIVTLRGSIVFAFQGRLLSFEGVETQSMEVDVDFLASYLKSFVENKPLYGSVIAEVRSAELSGSDLFDRYLSLHEKNAITRKIAEEKVKRTGNKLFRSVYFVFEYPVFENPREFYETKNVQAKMESAFEKVKTMCDSFERLYAASYGERPKKLTGLEIWQHLFRMINPYLKNCPSEISIYRSAREQLFLDDVYDSESDLTLRYNGTYFGCTYLDMLPATVDFASGTKLFSRIPFEARMVVSFEIPNQVKIKELLSSQRSWASMFTSKKRGNPESEKNKAKIEAIDELLSLDKEFITCTNVTFTVWGRKRSEVEDKLTKLQSIILLEYKTAFCYSNRYRKAKMFVSGLGYFPSYAYPKRHTTLTATACLIPFRSYLEGTTEEPVMLFSNRSNGVTALSLFSKKQNRWSFLAIGPTGSGKSFVTNHFLLSHLSLNPKIVVFDMAAMSSYRALVQMCGGEYVEVKPAGKGVSRNVFDFPLGFESPSERKQVFLDLFFSYVLSDENAPLVKEDYELLRRAIKRTYEKILQESPKVIPEEGEFEKFAKYVTWVNMRDEMIEKALREAEKGNVELRDKYLKLAELAHRHAMPVLEDLSSTFAFDDAVNMTENDRAISSKLRKRLSLYTSGPAKKLFGSVTQFETTSDFVVVNLGFLRENLSLLVPVYLSFREYFWEKMAVHLDEVPQIMKRLYGEDYFVFEQTRPKFIIIDEYHNFNAAKEVIFLTDKDMRQTRTYGIGVGIITQSLRDVIYEGKDEKCSIFESAANKFLLRHTSPENPNKEVVDYVVSKTGMNRKDAELFSSLKIVPGKYSEMYYLGEEIGKGVLVYEPVPAELWINTTHKGERFVRDGLIDKLIENFTSDEKSPEDKEVRNLIVAEVIDYLATNYPEGMTHLTDNERVDVFQRAYMEIKQSLEKKLGSRAG